MRAARARRPGGRRCPAAAARRRAIQHFELPLQYASIIRQQAAEKHLDPALIAAVIYAETRFRPRTSPTGAEGLMQIEPATAKFLAHRSGGYAFKVTDLGTPAGQHRLRQLLPALPDERVPRQQGARARRLQRRRDQRRQLARPRSRQPSSESPSRHPDSSDPRLRDRGARQAAGLPLALRPASSATADPAPGDSCDRWRSHRRPGVCGAAANRGQRPLRPATTAGLRRGGVPIVVPSSL